MATVSLCMIIKDEAETLQRCLESVRGLVDEIIIIDTGSSDGSQEIAQAYATVFEEIPWPGSFSLARNVSLSKATMDYIMILDGDEWLNTPDAWPTVKGLLDRQPDAIAVRVHNELPEGQVLSSDHIYQVRLFRNCQEYRYSGRVHNQISEAILGNPRQGDKAIIFQCDLTLYHKGYTGTPEELREKYVARMAMLEEELSMHLAADDQKMIAYYRFQLASAWFMIKDLEKVVEQTNQIVYDVLTNENAYSCHLIAMHSNLRLSHRGKAHWHSEQMLRLAPNEPMSFFMRGVTTMELKDFPSAYSFLIAAFVQVQRAGSVPKYHLDLYKVAEPCGDVCLMMERLGEAKWFYQLHLQKFPANERVKDLDARIIKQGSDVGSIEEDPLPVPELEVKPVPAELSTQMKKLAEIALGPTVSQG